MYGINTHSKEMVLFLTHFLNCMALLNLIGSSRMGNVSMSFHAVQKFRNFTKILNLMELSCLPYEGELSLQKYCVCGRKYHCKEQLGKSLSLTMPLVTCYIMQVVEMMQISNILRCIS